MRGWRREGSGRAAESTCSRRTGQLRVKHRPPGGNLICLKARQPSRILESTMAFPGWDLGSSGCAFEASVVIAGNRSTCPERPSKSDVNHTVDRGRPFWRVGALSAGYGLDSGRGHMTDPKPIPQLIRADCCQTLRTRAFFLCPASGGTGMSAGQPFGDQVDGSAGAVLGPGHPHTAHALPHDVSVSCSCT